MIFVHFCGKHSCCFVHFQMSVIIISTFDSKVDKKEKFTENKTYAFLIYSKLNLIKKRELVFKTELSEDYIPSFHNQ